MITLAQLVEQWLRNRDVECYFCIDDNFWIRTTGNGTMLAVIYEDCVTVGYGINSRTLQAAHPDFFEQLGRELRRLTGR